MVFQCVLERFILAAGCKRFVDSTNHPCWRLNMFQLKICNLDRFCLSRCIFEYVDRDGVFFIAPLKRRAWSPKIDFPLFAEDLPSQALRFPCSELDRVRSSRFGLGPLKHLPKSKLLPRNSACFAPEYDQPHPYGWFPPLCRRRRHRYWDADWPELPANIPHRPGHIRNCRRLEIPVSYLRLVGNSKRAHNVQN
jgi:hypothetical protein